MSAFLTTLFLFSPTAQAFRCLHQIEMASFLFTNQVWTGERIVPHPPFSTTPSDTVYRLGNGYAGGIVYRIFSVQQKPKVIKDYYMAEEAVIDAYRFNLLKTTLEEFPNSNEAQFKIVEVKSLQGTKMELENNYGVTLQSLIDNKEIHPEMKTYLIQKYEALLANAFKALQKKIPELKNFGAGYFRPISDTNVRKKFILKPENILITPSGDFIIIDLY